MTSKSQQPPIEKKPRPGPDPDRVKIDGEWEGVVSQALKKKRPKEGWANAQERSSGNKKSGRSPLDEA